VAKRRRSRSGLAQHMRDRVAYLVDASEVLVSSLDLAETLDKVATMAVPRLADACSIELFDDDGSVRTAAVGHPDPAFVERFKAFRLMVPPDLSVEYGIGKVLRTGEPELIPDIPPEALAQAARSREHLDLLREFGLHSLMIVPLSARGRTLGAISFFSGPSDRVYGPEDLFMAMELARRAGLALDNASLYASAQRARMAAERAAERIAALQEITAELAGAVTPADVADAVLRCAPRALGTTRAVIALVSEDGDALEVSRWMGYDESEMQQWRRFPIEAPLPMSDAVRSGIPILMSDTEARNRQYPTLRGFAERHSHALACVPLTVEHRAVGAMAFSFAQPRAFDDADLAFLMALGRQCGQALERARLYEVERRIAETLQRSLLPERLPQVRGLSLAARYLPAGRGEQVGGDWYDAIVLPDGQVGLAVGDVAGHGIRAATTMGQLRNGLRAYASEASSPAEVLERLDRLMAGSDHASMTTLAYLVLTPETGMLEYACAGHPPPLLCSTEGIRFLDQARSIPLGVLDHPAFLEARDHLPPDGRLLLYTDGLVDRRSQSIADGLSKLEAAATSSIGDLEDLCDNVFDVVFGGELPEDDVALLAVELAGADQERLDLRLPAEPRILSSFRRRVARFLDQVAASATERYEILVAVSEASANAIEHAYGPGDAMFEVRMDRNGGEISVEITDFGRWREPGRPDRGRGLPLIRNLMDDVDLSSGPDGTTVRMRRRLGAMARA
jgi:GAF domain-containing protein/anti-sigma regulatory factor (Ser/Thr protein kinase)